MHLQEQIKEAVKDFNRSADISVPVHLRYSSNLASTHSKKTISLIIGEQHSGSYRNLNFAKTNRTLSKFLLSLYQNPAIKMGDAFKEGYSEIGLDQNYKSYELEDFLLAGCNPLVTVLHLINRENTEFKVHASESKELFVKFSLLAYFLASFPDTSRSLETEERRILDLIKSDIDDEKKDLIISLNKIIYQDLGLALLEREKLIKLYKQDGLELYRFRFLDTNTKQQELQEGYKYKALSLMKKYALERDQFIVQSFLNKSSEGIHPIVIGEKHTENLINLFEKANIAVIYCSSFTSS